MALPVHAEKTDPVALLDPMFAQMNRASAGHCWAVPELTDREKVFLAAVADVCHATLGLPFELHVQAGLERGVSAVDIRAMLRFISYDSGYPAALAGFERLAQIERAAGERQPRTEPLAPELLKTGPDAAPNPLPPPVQARLRELDPAFAEYFGLQSRMRTGYEPGTLSNRERAFLTMSVDVHYQTLGDTFRIHVGRALGAGATPEDVRAVLRFLAQFGATRAWQAWPVLNSILAGTSPTR